MRLNNYQTMQNKKSPRFGVHIGGTALKEYLTNRANYEGIQKIEKFCKRMSGLGDYYKDFYKAALNKNSKDSFIISVNEQMAHFSFDIQKTPLSYTSHIIADLYAKAALPKIN